MARTLPILLLILFIFSCSPNQKSPPNILLIVSEDNGPDLGCYGVDEVHTPNLDALAQEGILFRNVFVTYSVCSPSRSTLFTGMYPHQNGQIGLATHNYSMYEGIITLPVYLKEAGYRTGCIGKIHVNPESAVPWDYRPGGRLNGSNFDKKDLPLYAEAAGEFMNASETQFFLMVNYPDAHYPLQDTVEGMPHKVVSSDQLDGSLPFVGADSERLRLFTANYYSSMNRLDEAVGMLFRVLEKSGKADNTLIIYLGDHGAQFSRGKCSNYEAALQIPLLMKWNGHITSDQDVEHLISTVDLLPTLLTAVGLEIPEDLPGRSLHPFYLGENVQDWRQYIFAGGAGSAAKFCFPRRSIRNERFKLICNLLLDRDNPHFSSYAKHINVHFSGGTEVDEIMASSSEIQHSYWTWKNPPEYELYDLKSDPFEFHNLGDIPEYNEILMELKGQLYEWQVSTNDPLLNKVILKRFVEECDEHINTPPKSIDWQYHTYFK